MPSHFETESPVITYIAVAADTNGDSEAGTAWALAAMFGVGVHCHSGPLNDAIPF